MLLLAFERCEVFVGGVRLGGSGVCVCVRVFRCRGCCSLSVCVCDLLIFFQQAGGLHFDEEALGRLFTPRPPPIHTYMHTYLDHMYT